MYHYATGCKRIWSKGLSWGTLKLSLSSTFWESHFPWVLAQPKTQGEVPHVCETDLKHKMKRELNILKPQGYDVYALLKSRL